MGAAQTKNVASQISEVTTSVSNEVNVSATFIDDVKQSVIIDCNVGGNVNVQAGMTNSTKARQISKLSTDTTLINTINQKMLQSAISDVGTLGVGYASASNTATAYSSVSNQVKSTINDAVNALSLTDQTLRCGPDATIRGNLNIKFTAGNQFISDQEGTSTQINNIANTVTQEIDQKASATVEGIGSLIMLIIIVIVLVVIGGLSSVKPSAGSNNGGASRFSNKSVGIGTGVLVFLTGVFLTWGYIGQLPPFFSAPKLGSPNSSSSVGKCEAGLIDIKKRSVFLNAPPLRYNYPIIEAGPNGSLLALAIIKVAGGSANTLNGGMNGQNYLDQGDANQSNLWAADNTYQKLLDEDGTSVMPQLPNLLRLYTCKVEPKGNALIPSAYLGQVAGSIGKSGSDRVATCVPGGFTCGPYYDCNDTDGYTDCNGDKSSSLEQSGTNVGPFNLAVPNTAGWKAYISPGGIVNKKRANHARFILCRVLGVPVDVYVDDDEEVEYKDPDGVLKYGGGASESFGSEPLRYGKFASWNYTDAVSPTSTGEVTGNFGVYNTQLQSFQTGANRYGIAIIVTSIVLGVVIIISLQVYQHRKGFGAARVVPSIK